MVGDTYACTSHILLALCMGEHERKVPWTHLDSAWTLLQFHAFAWYHSAYRMWSDCDLMFKAGYMWSCPSLSTVMDWYMDMVYTDCNL